MPKRTDYEFSSKESLFARFFSGKSKKSGNFFQILKELDIWGGLA
jgi:hypothetical protein